MTDPCWLPSAIMQTTGALLGIYAVIYVFVMQRYWDRSGARRIAKTHIRELSYLFYAFIFFGSATIILNTCWLDYITRAEPIGLTNILFKVSWMQDVAIALFISTVILICAYSITMIASLK